MFCLFKFSVCTLVNHDLIMDLEIMVHVRMRETWSQCIHTLYNIVVVKNYYHIVRYRKYIIFLVRSLVLLCFK